MNYSDIGEDIVGKKIIEIKCGQKVFGGHYIKIKCDNKKSLILSSESKTYPLRYMISLNDLYMQKQLLPNVELFFGLLPYSAITEVLLPGMLFGQFMPSRKGDPCTIRLTINKSLVERNYSELKYSGKDYYFYDFLSFAENNTIVLNISVNTIDVPMFAVTSVGSVNLDVSYI